MTLRRSADRFVAAEKTPLHVTGVRGGHTHNTVCVLGEHQCMHEHGVPCMHTARQTTNPDNKTHPRAVRASVHGEKKKRRDQWRCVGSVPVLRDAHIHAHIGSETGLIGSCFRLPANTFVRFASSRRYVVGSVSSSPL